MPPREIATLAVLADIHGNLPALEAVLIEVEAAAPDLIVLNGDLADGPFPVETLDVLERLGERALWLRGNGDRWLVETLSGRFRHEDRDTDALLCWCAERIAPGHRARLGALPLSRTIDVVGMGRVGFCHATARSDNEMVLVDSPLSRFSAAFAAIEAETLIVGHCHMPFDRLFEGRRIVNTGSVGIPYGHTGASWAWIGPDVVLRRTPYDIEAACARIARSGMPGAEDFIRNRIRTSLSDVEALEAFHATAQEQEATGSFD